MGRQKRDLRDRRKETERHRDRDRDTERKTETERWRQIKRERETETDKQMDTEKETEEGGGRDVDRSRHRDSERDTMMDRTPPPPVSLPDLSDIHNHPCSSIHMPPSRADTFTTPTGWGLEKHSMETLQSLLIE